MKELKVPLDIINLLGLEGVDKLLITNGFEVSKLIKTKFDDIDLIRTYIQEGD